MSARIFVCAAVLVCPLPASANSRQPVNLQLSQAPIALPATLAMRQPQNRGDSETTQRPAASGPDRPKPKAARGAGLPHTRAIDDAIAPPEPLSDRVIFRFNLGFGLDAGQPSGEPNLAGSQLSAVTDYEQLRIYGFGDAAIGSRGLVAPSLSTYLAAQFRFDQNIEQASTAIPSTRDADIDRLLIRSAYAEADELSATPLLRPLYMRAGRQFKYGLAVAHFDGLTVGYASPTVTVSAFAGQSVYLHGFDAGTHLSEGGVISGASAKLDMFELRRLPLVFSGDVLQFDGRRHLEGGVALRWSRTMHLRGSLRLVDDELAQQALRLRTRVSEVTTISVELDNQSRADWSYDLLLQEPTSDPTDPRRYLNLGPPLPRLHLNVRAGTVWFKNLDVLFRGAVAIEHRDPDRELPSSFRSSYVEGGGALEVRVRRSLRLGASASARRYGTTATDQVTSRPGLADPLLEHLGSVGVESFVEGGLNVLYTAGARRFNARTELYSRLYDMETPLVGPDADELDLRTGGRFSVEGWAGQRLRLRTEYDVSFNRLRLAPELNGVKTLRVLLEGTF